MVFKMAISLRFSFTAITRVETMLKQATATTISITTYITVRTIWMS